jgi:hypothetical protein
MRFVTTLFALWLLFAPVLLVAQNISQQRIDSIKAILPCLKGKQRTEALANLCDYAYNLGDSLHEQKCWKQLLEEADQIGDTENAGMAYLSLMVCYFNFNNFDRLEAELPDALAY